MPEDFTRLKLYVAQDGTPREYKGWYVDRRVNAGERKELSENGWNIYEIRRSDDKKVYWETVVRSAGKKISGSFISKDKLPMGEDETMLIHPETDFDFPFR